MIAVRDSYDFSLVTECPFCGAIDLHEWVSSSASLKLVVRECLECHTNWSQS